MYKFNLAIKRCFDVAASLILLVLLFPLFLLVIAAIKLDSRGPAIFKQERRTKDGKIFQMYKFRSMYADAVNTGPFFCFENDPRETRVGRFIRKTSIDELPQLINILRGEMSIVGPRPCQPNELGDFKTLNKMYKKRFEVNAGLTGLAQIKGRKTISWHEKIYYDDEYIDTFKQVGILIDLKIVFITILQIFVHSGVYHIKRDGSMNSIEASEQLETEVIRDAHMPDEM
ncbi:sugar transferase [bacterium]|nr:sugar transferase [bacterium]